MSIVKNWQIFANLAGYGTWENVDGFDLDIATDDYYPAGARIPVKLPSTGKYGDLTVSRAYDPSNDKRAMDWVKATLNGTGNPAVLTVVVINDQSVVQTTINLLVKPTGFKMPSGKSGDGGVSEFTLKLCVQEQQ